MDLIDEGKRDELRDALEKDFPAIVTLRNECAELSRRLKDTQAELDSHKSILNMTLLDKDMVQRALLDELLEHKDDLRAADQVQYGHKLALGKRQEGPAEEVPRTGSTEDQLNHAPEESESLLQQLITGNKVPRSGKIPEPLNFDDFPTYDTTESSLSTATLLTPELEIVQHVQEKDRFIEQLLAELSTLRAELAEATKPRTETAAAADETPAAAAAQPEVQGPTLYSIISDLIQLTDNAASIEREKLQHQQQQQQQQQPR